MNAGQKITVLALMVASVVMGAGAEPPGSTPVSVDMASLELQTQSYSYLGQGQFMSMRSDRQPWITLKVDSCTYDPTDSTLHLTGSLYDCMRHTDFSAISFQALTGRFSERCADAPVDSKMRSDTGDTMPPDLNVMSTHPCLDRWQWYAIRSAAGFTIDVDVTPGSFLFFVPAEADSGGYPEFMSAAIFEIGKLPQRQTYIEILRKALDADTLQPYFYRTPDGEAYPLTVADDVLSALAVKPPLEKFGRPVTLLSKNAADSAGLPAYFWVIDYVQRGNEARIQLEDPVRHILFGASYTRDPSGWTTESTYLQQEE